MMPRLPRLPWRWIAWHAVAALLVLWAVGLVVAGIRLDTWRQELSQTLLQLHADTRFRARAAQREAVDPAWYRRKALGLLAAAERLRRDAWWRVFVPGSWEAFDDLEERLQRRLAREFGDIVVETLRRELLARGGRLTGIPVVAGSGDLQAGADCIAPLSRDAALRGLSAAPEDLPEYTALVEYVLAVEQLDGAARSLAALQQAGGGDPAQLRQLVRYALGVDVPGPLAGSVRLFHDPDEVSVQPALLQAQLRGATRCSLGKAMAALHTRLLDTNELFALEAALQVRSAGLFDARPRPAPFDRTVERYRAVLALLEDQHALLARGRNDWMRQGSLQLGAGFERLLARIGRNQLLGPEVLRELEGRSGAAFAEFRRQFEATFGHGEDAGIAWLEHERRFGLSPRRAALREGLAALLHSPFMAETAPAFGAGGLSQVVLRTQGLGEAWQRFQAEVLPLFPPDARPGVERLVAGRLAELAYQDGYRAVKAGLPRDLATPLDPVRFREQREQVAGVQAVLEQLHARALSGRLGELLDQELRRRLDVLHDDWLRHAVNDARGSDFGWWQGEPLFLAQLLNAGEGPAHAGGLARLATRLDLLGQQAETLLELGSPRFAEEASARRWPRLKSELARFHAGQQDSSLVRLERFLAGLGPDLRRENCAERLAVVAPPVHDDEIGLRLGRVQQALAARCGELRFQPALPTLAGPAPLPAPQ